MWIKLYSPPFLRLLTRSSLVSHSKKKWKKFVCFLSLSPAVHSTSRVQYISACGSILDIFAARERWWKLNFSFYFIFFFSSFLLYLSSRILAVPERFSWVVFTLKKEVSPHSTNFRLTNLLGEFQFFIRASDEVECVFCAVSWNGVQGEDKKRRRHKRPYQTSKFDID